MGNAGSAAADLGSGRGEPGHVAGRRARGVEPVQPVGDDAANWERFHLRCNKSARFYKERRRAPSLHRTEHGCLEVAPASAADVPCTRALQLADLPRQKTLLTRGLHGARLQV